MITKNKKVFSVYTIYVLISLNSLCNLFFACTTSSNKSYACNIYTLKTTEENLNNLSEEIISVFLFTFSSECSSNIEYSEYSNELLFKIFTKEPQLFLNTLDTYHKEIDMNAVSKDLSEPLLDNNISELIIQTKKSKIDPKLKQRIIDNLQASN